MPAISIQIKMYGEFVEELSPVKSVAKIGPKLGCFDSIAISARLICSGSGSEIGPGNTKVS